MATQKVSFKVAMDQEQKLLKNFHSVELEVEMDVPVDVLQKYAMKAFVVELQGQIRPNWDAFIKGDYPKTLDLGHALFGKKERKALTIEEKKAAVKAEVDKLSPREKVKYMFDGGFITEEQYETLLALQPEE